MSRRSFAELLIPVLPVVFMVFLIITAERAETIGHTNLSGVRAREGGNYAVFRRGRYIQLSTILAPGEIRERDGKIVRVHTVLLRILPVKTYFPATPAEEALWRHYFEE